MRAVSLSTINKYRKNARYDRNIPDDVLKVKLNCLINAVEKEHIYSRGSATVYQFGSCLFYVIDNIITDIRWTEERTEKPNDYEINRMIRLYLSNGLNCSGKRFVDKTK